MGHLKITPLNVRGLNIPEKRSQLLADLRRGKTHVAFLQETYFRADSIPRLTNGAFPVAYHSVSPISKSKGVSIILARSVPWVFEAQRADAQGRFLLLKGRVSDVRVTFANVYFPNVDHPQFMRKLLSELLEFSEGMLIFGGDLNFAMDPTLDVSRGASHLSYSRLRRLKADLHTLHLVDPWRLLHNQDRDYTFYSQVHHTYSRLDYLLLSHKDLNKVVSSSIDVISFSDHAPVHLTLQLGPMARSPPSWRLNEALLQSEETRSEILNTLREYFSVNEGSVSNPLVVWEAHKTVVRGALIKIGARLKRDRLRRTEELLALIRNLESIYKASLVRATFRDLQKAREELCTLLFHKTKQKLAWARRTMFEFTNKPGSLLARALQGPRTKTYIPHIQSSMGQKLNTSSDMAEEFRSFYTGLYNLDRPQSVDSPTEGSHTPQSYLAASGMPSLPDNVREELEEPLTVAELGSALASSKPKKAPGPDGLTPVYYKTFFDILSKPLVSALNTITEGNSFPVDTLRAYISLIPKEGKDPLLCYRPIALLNSDLKLFAKILANRLLPHIPSLIHRDQAGFVPL